MQISGLCVIRLLLDFSFHLFYFLSNPNLEKNLHFNPPTPTPHQSQNSTTRTSVLLHADIKTLGHIWKRRLVPVESPEVFTLHDSLTCRPPVEESGEGGCVGAMGAGEGWTEREDKLDRGRKTRWFEGGTAKLDLH